MGSAQLPHSARTVRLAHHTPSGMSTQLVFEADLQRKSMGHPTSHYLQVPWMSVPWSKKAPAAPIALSVHCLTREDRGPATDDHPGLPGTPRLSYFRAGSTHQDSFTHIPRLCWVSLYRLLFSPQIKGLRQACIRKCQGHFPSTCSLHVCHNFGILTCFKLSLLFVMLI